MIDISVYWFWTAVGLITLLVSVYVYHDVRRSSQALLDAVGSERDRAIRSKDEILREQDGPQARFALVKKKVRESIDWFTELRGQLEHPPRPNWQDAFDARERVCEFLIDTLGEGKTDPIHAAFRTRDKIERAIAGDTIKESEVPRTIIKQTLEQLQNLQFEKEDVMDFTFSEWENWSPKLANQNIPDAVFLLREFKSKVSAIRMRCRDERTGISDSDALAIRDEFCGLLRSALIDERIPDDIESWDLSGESLVGALASLIDKFVPQWSEHSMRNDYNP